MLTYEAFTEEVLCPMNFPLYARSPLPPKTKNFNALEHFDNSPGPGPPDGLMGNSQTGLNVEFAMSS